LFKELPKANSHEREFEAILPISALPGNKAAASGRTPYASRLRL
jgi:hypothetical protein